MTPLRSKMRDDLRLRSLGGAGNGGSQVVGDLLDLADA